MCSYLFVSVPRVYMTQLHYDGWNALANRNGSERIRTADQHWLLTATDDVCTVTLLL